MRRTKIKGENLINSEDRHKTCCTTQIHPQRRAQFRGYIIVNSEDRHTTCCTTKIYLQRTKFRRDIIVILKTDIKYAVYSDIHRERQLIKEIFVKRDNTLYRDIHR